MTKNQIDYWNTRESIRHSQAMEAETALHNRNMEAETAYHNRVTEQQTQTNLIEQARHNVAVEQEAHRSNQMSELLKEQSNYVSKYGYDLSRSASHEITMENQRHNMVGEAQNLLSIGVQDATRLTNASQKEKDRVFTAARVVEEKRHNLAQEGIAGISAISSLLGVGLKAASLGLSFK